jgi:hypothetical protein
LIEALDVSTMGDSPAYLPVSLTWEGHEFLEASRSSSVWKKTVELVTSKGGGLALELIKEVLMREAKNSLGL